MGSGKRYIWESIRKRSIQIGIKGEYVSKYVYDWIMNITDITDYVQDLLIKRNQGVDIIPLLPKEEIYRLIVK